MKWKSAGTMLCLTAMLLAGCNSDDSEQKTQTTETSTISENDYAAVLPFKVSDARSKHASLVDRFEIGSGLIELSKEHFSPKTYAYQENQFLTYNALDAYNDGSGLLGRMSEKNPNGLNPESGTSFPTDKGDLKDPVIVLNVFEADWYKGTQLSGLSLALVIQSKITDSETNKTYTLNQAKLKIFAEEQARKTIKYLRDTHPEISDDMPIYLAVYDCNSEEEGIPGNFTEQAYFKSGTDGSFSTLDNTWCLFPTDASNTLDSTTHSYFTSYKSKLSDINLGDDISIIGKGEFWDKDLETLSITVTARAKTSLEMNAIIQTLNQNLSIFTSTDFRITVNIKCDDTEMAMIERAKGTTKTNVISLLN